MTERRFDRLTIIAFVVFLIVWICLLTVPVVAQIIGGGMTGARRYRALQFAVGESQAELTGDEALSLSGEDALGLVVSVNATKGP